MHYHFYLKHVNRGAQAGKIDFISIIKLISTRVESECVFRCLETLLEVSGGFEVL